VVVPKNFRDVGAPPKKEKKEKKGMAIRIHHLNFDISEHDLKELFSTVGKVEKCRVECDKSGRSCGRAEVYFAFKSDAVTAKNTFDGRTLDGTAMTIALGGNKQDRWSGDDNKAAFFGTALNNNSYPGSGRSKGSRGRGRGRGRGRSGGRGR
jgi:THO complex subunit 4